jgi:hypothetical protein
MIDVHTTVRTFLLANAGLTDLVNTRVFAGRNEPPPGYTPGDGPCVTFKARGGAGPYRGRDYEDALIVPSMQFKCYGASEVEAYQVYRALADALHGRHGASILHAEEAGVGQPLEEPDTEWRFVLSFFDVMVRSA